MKLLIPEALAERGQVATLKHEAKVQISLVHPSFIPLHQLVVGKKQAYIVMDYFRAANLKIQIMTDIVGVQSRIRKLIETVCLALGYMHDKGWVHRDIKPENILFNKSGELKLIDFSLSVRCASGVSKLFAGKAKIIRGTRTYIAPETLLKKAATPQTDMYSLAITLFELITGQGPFTASTPDELLNKHLKETPPPPSQFNDNVTPEMDQFILRMLAKKPVNRFANMNEMLAEFRSLKVFKEDVLEIQAEAERKEKEFLRTGGDLSDGLALSSRDDAMRDKTIARSPRRRKPKPKLAPPPPAAPPSPAGFPQQLPPQPYPPQPFPVQPFPVQPQPGALPQYVPPGYYQPGMIPPPPQQPMMPAAHAPQQALPPLGNPVAPGFAGPPPNAVPMPQPLIPDPGVPTSPAQLPPLPQSAATGAGAAPTSPEVLKQSQPPQSQPLVQSPAQPGEPPQVALQPRQGGGDQISGDRVELQPQAPIPDERHASQSDSDADLPLMDELPEIE
jgi:serine/threonine-protein kinase